MLANARPTAEIWSNRGIALTALGRHAEAVASYDQAVALDGAHLTAWGNRGRTMKALGRHQEAVESYDRVLAVAPGHVAALNERGSELLALDRALDALASFDAALLCEPGNIDALLERSGACCRLNRFDDALADADAAMAVDVQNPRAHDARGNALQGLDRFDEAVEAYQTSLSLGPGVASVHAHLGGALHVLDRHDEALLHFDQALMLGAPSDETRASKSLIYLSTGRLAEGWEYDDCRLADPSIVCRAYPQPRWDGSPVAGTLLVWGEQGLGHQIMHASMIPELTARASGVVVEVEPRLVDLFARSFPDVRVVAIGSELYAGDLQAQVPIGSLGRHLRPDFDAFVRHEAGFLAPDPMRAQALRKRLTTDGRTVVGLSWKSQNQRPEKGKSARLADFEAVLRQPGCRFIDLQYGDTLSEREAVERELGVRVERLGCVDNTKDIDGLAALMAACDVVVTVSNTTAHLAGAVGRPTFVLVPFGHTRLWYWFKDRADSPWYPRLRVLRQLNGQSWAELIASGARAIARSIETA